MNSISVGEQSCFVTVRNKYGLHGRPATRLVKLAQRFHSTISVGTHSRVVDAKSIMKVMMLCVESGSTLVIRAEGVDAAEAVQELAALVERRFDDED